MCGFGGVAEAAVGICFPSAEEGLWYGMVGAGRGGAGPRALLLRYGFFFTVYWHSI